MNQFSIGILNAKENSQSPWFSHGLEKNGKTFSSREKSENFEPTGKVEEFYPKYWKSEVILPKILEK